MDFVFLEENYVRKAYQHMAKTREENSPVDSRGRHQQHPKLSCVLQFMKSLSANSLILDVGCGENAHVREDCFTIGMDICVPMPTSFESRDADGYDCGGTFSSSGKTQSKSKNVDFVLADMRYPPFRNSLFDAILMVSVLHHVPLKKRRMDSLRKCLSLSRPGHSDLLVIVWSREQQQSTSKFASNDVLVPYNLEELCKQNYIPEIPFNNFSTKEQRIIQNSVPVHIVDHANWVLPAYCQRYLPRRVHRQLLDVATRLATFYPLFTSVDFYEQRLQCAVKFLIERIDELRHFQAGGTGQKNVTHDGLPGVVRGFAYKVTVSAFEEAFIQLRTIHREVLRYRYYHVFDAGELRQLVAETMQDTARRPVFQLEILKDDHDCGNWYLHAGITRIKDGEGIENVG